MSISIRLAGECPDARIGAIGGDGDFPERDHVPVGEGHERDDRELGRDPGQKIRRTTRHCGHVHGRQGPAESHSRRSDVPGDHELIARHVVPPRIAAAGSQLAGVGFGGLDVPDGQLRFDQVKQPRSPLRAGLRSSSQRLPQATGGSHELASLNVRFRLAVKVRREYQIRPVGRGQPMPHRGGLRCRGRGRPVQLSPSRERCLIVHSLMNEPVAEPEPLARRGGHFADEPERGQFVEQTGGARQAGQRGGLGELEFSA